MKEFVAQKLAAGDRGLAVSFPMTHRVQEAHG